jgi:hypothetical protein
MPLAKFHVERHFIYITARRDETKEEFYLYYKLTNEDTAEITKEWPEEFLVSVKDAELSDPDIIRIPLVTRNEYDGQSSVNKKKKNDGVQDIENDEEDIASDESRHDSPAGGGGDEVNQEEEGKEGENKYKGEVTPLNDPLTTAEAS